MMDPDDRSVLPVEEVAELLSVSVETIRTYEQHGLVRSCSTDRELYSHRHIQRIRRAETVVALGVNLPGAEVVCNLLERLDELNHELDVRKEELRRLLEEE